MPIYLLLRVPFAYAVSKMGQAATVFSATWADDQDEITASEYKSMMEFL